jgi:hypothetical protein
MTPVGCSTAIPIFTIIPEEACKGNSRKSCSAATEQQQDGRTPQQRSVFVDYIKQKLASAG